ncbi:MAG: hypothetical protein QW727_02735 [Candidatus Pacearchaeota archaeon]
MKIKSLKAREIKDTRGESTIEISLITDFGEFISSAPNGKSRGKFEVKTWRKSLKEDIKSINNFFIEDINIRRFEDLILLENTFNKIIGGNSMITLEYSFLKALAFIEDKEVWELINSRAKKFPLPIGNAISGGLHSSNKKKPDFQEFHFIPVTSFSKSVQINKRALENCSEILKNTDINFSWKKSDENAWQTSLNNEQVIEVMKQVRDNMKDEFKTTIHLGIDVAASSFYKNGSYIYTNPKSTKIKREQIKLMNKLAKDMFYIEDPLEEEDFIGFSKIKSNGLIVGDDLTTTNFERLKIAYLKKSINAIIIKPNQIGSLIEVKKIVDYCKDKKIKIIFSHRSGETSENILADLAFGFEADFIKIGIEGPGRDEKIFRLIEIERNMLGK